MTLPRKLILSKGESSYHCVSRCVRRAYLYGFDKISGKNYDHRKEWIRDRLKLLVEIFTIEVLAYALMDNHGHTLLRTRPDLLAQLSDEEIVKRWLMLYPKKGISDDLESRDAKDYIAKHIIDKERINILKKRLCSVSWFMKSLNEHIARKANKEDECKGRFWEGRFKCTRLDTSAALLSCAVYIDLNPIRAGKAKTPETSEYTSVHERIHAPRPLEEMEPELWVAPLRDSNSRKGFTSLAFSEYLTLVDITGRELRKGKKGNIPSILEPILVRLGIRPTGWLDSVQKMGSGYAHCAGNEQSLREHAMRIGQTWVKGINLARKTFA
jgi:REP element-mobilizing transposase RayT